MIGTIQYLSENNIHFKPISARYIRCMMDLTISAKKQISTTHWCGRAVHFSLYAHLLTQQLVIIPIALIEALSFATIGTTGLAINALFSNRSDFIRKHSIKSLAYATNCSLLVVAAALLVIKKKTPLEHTAVALIDHLFHIGSAAFAHGFIGRALDLRSKNIVTYLAADLLADTRLLNLLKENYLYVLGDLLTQFRNDLGGYLLHETVQHLNFETYLERAPHARAFFANLSLDRISDPQYRQEGVRVMVDYLREMNLIRPEQVRSNATYEINSSPQNVTTYQNHLKQQFKEAFSDIYRTDRLSHCLDHGEDTGTDLLDMLDGSIFMPLGVYAQYKELQSPIQCPVQFNRHLERYNSRSSQLLAVQVKVNALIQAEKEALEEKILRGSDITASPNIQEIYLEINTLATALQQGPLVTRVALDLRGFRNGGNLLDETNLFQSAFQEALTEISTNPAPAQSV